MTTKNQAALESSTDMSPVCGTVDVDIPVDILWQCFTRADWWPRWNTCMYLALNHDLVEGQQLL
jgi:hypothetical protein